MARKTQRLTPAQWAREYFDAYGEKEWDRLDNDLSGNMSFRIHRSFLAEFIAGGSEVLELGAGPGRFTREIAALRARVFVSDISKEQLRLNAKYVSSDPALETRVSGREQLDICDLSSLPAGSFDVTVCFGGPLSYVFDQADAAVDEMIRVTRDDGAILISVMSLWGALRVYLPSILAQIRDDPSELPAFDRIVETGDLPFDDPGRHACRMYTFERLFALLSRHGLRIVRASASNMLTASEEIKTHASTFARGSARRDLSELLTDRAAERLAAWEKEACASRENLDGGTHLVVAARRAE